MQTETIESITRQFVADLTEVISEKARDRARAAILEAIGTAPKRGPGRPPGKRRGPPRDSMQYTCPIPRCEGRAAPVFGMLCSEHKGTNPKLVAKYRAERRARKAAGR